MKTKTGIILGAFLFLFAANLFAQEDNKLVSLTKQVIESKIDSAVFSGFEELKGMYFKDYRYTDFVEFLGSLLKQRKDLEPFVDYYIALSRYQQLKYLEESQGWDEYFSEGNTYRDQITTSAQKVIEGASPKSKLRVLARLILWKFHQGQQDPFAQEALSGLIEDSKEYMKDSLDPSPVKEAADELARAGEKSKAKELYLLYVDKLTSSKALSDEELKNTGLAFLKGDNPELAEILCDLYIERLIKVSSKEKYVPVLMELAKQFSYKDNGAYDASYAEKIFKKIEELAGREAFNEEQIHLRAFNSEKARDYTEAKELYSYLDTRFLTGSYRDEAEYKIGMIHCYVLRDIKSARDYFTRVSQRTTPSAQSIASLYQLGLLSQWQNDLPKAKEYYDTLITAAAGNFQETAELAKSRLKEISASKPIEYNLKTFLDVSLLPENAIFNMAMIDLRSSAYQSKPYADMQIKSNTAPPEAGCMEVEMQYLWSGHLGKASPSLNQPAFETSYTHSGTKEINLVVVSPTGVVDRKFDMVDVY